MTKIDIFSGFLGAGKTTLIKKLIEEAFKGEKLVLIENEFGEIGIDGGFLKEAGVQINEMNSGCICCSLVGDFEKALGKVLEDYAPDRIIIEPSGVGKLSDVIKAVQAVVTDKVCLNGFVTVADATKCKMYIKNLVSSILTKSNMQALSFSAELKIFHRKSLMPLSPLFVSIIAKQELLQLHGAKSLVKTFLQQSRVIIPSQRTSSKRLKFAQPADIITMTTMSMTTSIAVMTITDIITMLMKYSQAGARKLQSTSQRKKLKKFSLL